MSTYYVLGSAEGGDAVPWVLSIEGYPTIERAEAAIRWQYKPYDRNPDPSGYWKVATYDPDEKAFVTSSGETLRPNGRPYTAEAWKAFCNRLGYAATT